ncbi:EccC-like translocase [Mycobacterium phage prophiT46-2]|uniref:DNA translocase FtsK n=1 Tax=Mycobacteroides abscessus TaxID=36809 RepID=UPI00232D84C8|nr:DNA translocase FtsK [Mycobacteroides abscessus]MDB2219061.1 DNA translocase FtsK [Mycobacteroides abscessus subsp. abscessus]WJJ56213.1 EccC-like translocase [Mycobacterium phage prophiT46-2]
MSITVATKKLIEVLTDALAVSNGTGGGVHLTTTRGPWREEPGDVDLLVATSTTKNVLGHTWIPVDGRIDPMVWPCQSVKDVLTLCKSWLKGDEHTVDIDLELADPPENKKDDGHPGWTIKLTETPALFDSDNTIKFHAHHGSRFPLELVSRIRTGRFPARDDYEEVPLTLWSAAVLSPLVKVAKRRNMQIQMFRSPERRLQLVQIGDTWIGAATPGVPLPGDPTDEPSIEPVLGAEDDLVAALKEMKRSGITVSVESPQGMLGEVVADAADKLAGGAGSRELLRQAVELITTTQFVSAANLQRKLNVGFAKAEWILAELTAAGIVTAAEGTSARKALFGPAQVADALKALGNVSEQ